MLRTVDDGRNENTYAYDAAGEPTVRTDKTGSGGVTNGSTLATTYSYNDAGLVSAMSSDVLDETTTYQWDDSGRMVRAETGDHVNEWSYHPDDTIAGAKNSAGGSTKSEYVYRYDNAGNLTTQIVSGAGPRYTDTFAYNPASNLTSWDHTPAQGDTSAGAAAGTTEYGWDRNSNRTSLKKGSARTTWTYRDDNSIGSRSVDPNTASTADTVETFDHAYDSAGRLTNDGCNTMGYDAFDRIKTQDQSGAQRCGDGGRSTTYTYDGLDRQRSMAVTGDSVAAANVTTRNVYDGMTTTMVGQTDAVNGANSAPDIVYQLGADGQAMAYEQSGAGAGKAFLDTDGRGNVTTVVGTDDAVQCAAPLDPFGNPVNPAATGGNDVCRSGTAMSATANSLWYRGQARDGSTGSYQLGTRTYDPSDAAFTTPDTYRVAAPPTDLSVTTDPLTANTYTYVNGNPVNMMDPDGHRVTCTEGPGPCGVKENGKFRETGKTVRPDGSIYTAAELQRRGEAELAASMSRREALAKKAAAEFDWKGALVDLGVEASGLGDIKRCVMDRDVGACAWAVAGTAGAAIFKAGKTIKKVKNLIDNVRSFNAAKRAASAALSKLDGQISKQAAELKSLAAKVKRSPSSGAGGARKASAKTEAPRRGDGGSSKSSGPREHACSLNSFAGRTLVLMGDKTKKPIEKVKVGDKVWATDPKTGEKGPRTVTHVWKHRDALVDIKVDGETITTTEDHPFWSESEGRFKDAEELRRGELLLRWDGSPAAASPLDHSTWRGGTAYNLTVSGLHTYHVGNADALVHNCGTSDAPRFITTADGTTIDRQGVASAVSLQKQRRHVKGSREYKEGGYFESVEDAQGVLDAFRDGRAEVLGINGNNTVVRAPGITGFNNNPGAGFLDQPTDVFLIKGTKRPSVVPANPRWSP